MKTSAKFACIFLLLHVRLSAQDSIRLITMDALLQSEENTTFIASLLTASRDNISNTLAFQFNAFRFRQRGYGTDMYGTYVNGLPVQSLENGNTWWASWSGLNDVMRNREGVAGLRNATFAFGAPGGNTQMDVRAGKQRKQTNITYAFSNRQYTHRLSYSYASGYNSKGWAIAFSLSRRWAAEGYAPGTSYNSNSYFMAIDKKAGSHHLLSLVLAGATTRSGMQAAAVQQTIQLTGNPWYNPYWGYQDGRKRNSNISNVHQPQVLFTHDFHPASHTTLITTIGYTAGARSVSGLDWYNAADPRPDYYRYLPDYVDNQAQKDQLTQAWSASHSSVSQINWDRLYNVNNSNVTTISDANGIAGNSVTGLRSSYILQQRITQVKQVAISSTLNIQPWTHVSVTAGVLYQWQRNRYYKKVEDLLGGDWFVDVNQFAEREEPDNKEALQNDLYHPNRLVTKGGLFGYHYDVVMTNAAAWLQCNYSLAHADVFVAGTVSSAQFYRIGYMRNGLFPYSSFGTSPVNSFMGYAGKMGLTWKFTGRHYAFVHAGYWVKPPYANSVYISPRTSSAQQDKVTAEIIQLAEAGYQLNAPKLSVKTVFYLTQTQHGLKVLSFYHDEYRNFVNYALSNIGKWYAGIETGIEAKLTPTLTLSMVAAVGRYYYHQRQQATVTADNSAAVLEKTTVFSKNYRLGNSPQEAYSATLMYRSPDAWFVSASGNYARMQWLEANPLRLTPQATDNVSNTTPLFQQIIQQQQWPAQATVNVFAGYTYRKVSKKKKSTYYNLYASINNLLNNRSIVAGAYEQLRFDFETKNRNTYPPKLLYGMGVNYAISLGIRY
ncbi:TonB-dependent receptor [Filimonas lacunae]|nr:hypothetical protein [Filimonas lacunae]BAV08437.1 hypothetical protein FLA_4478 [Filimonas lacunae]